MPVLFTKSDIDENKLELHQWERLAFEAFSNQLVDKENLFPCVPGRQGFLSGDMRFAFLPDPRVENARTQLAACLKEYGTLSAQCGRYTSFVAFFETAPDFKETYDVESCEELFWSILNEVHRLDSVSWPQSVAADPECYSWEFCFDGQPYFAACMTPCHKGRKSRYSTVFTIAFQPRFVFAHIHEGTEYGRRLKSIIRKRLAAYDDVPIHPALGWYGQKDNLEWKQYFLRDDDSTAQKCPFHHRKGEHDET